MTKKYIASILFLKDTMYVVLASQLNEKINKNCATLGLYDSVVLQSLMVISITMMRMMLMLMLMLMLIMMIMMIMIMAMMIMMKMKIKIKRRKKKKSMMWMTEKKTMITVSMCTSLSI